MKKKEEHVKTMLPSTQNPSVHGRFPILL